MSKAYLTLVPMLVYFIGGIFLAGCSSDDVEQTPQVDPILLAGEEIVKKNCKVCHGQGINGAPIIGNKKMWGKRVTQGIPTLVEHASQGFGLMPPKGGNTSLTHEEITAAVTYMVSQVK